MKRIVPLTRYRAFFGSVFKRLDDNGRIMAHYEVREEEDCWHSVRRLVILHALLGTSSSTKPTEKILIANREMYFYNDPESSHVDNGN